MAQSSETFAVRFSRRIPRSWLAVALVVLVLSGLIVGTARSGSDSGQSWGNTAVLAVLIVLALVALVSLLLQVAGVDAEASDLAERLGTDVEQRRLLDRWLVRARRARYIGGWSGVLVWLFGTGTHGNLLVFGFAGIAIGAVVAELHQVRRPSGVRTASLDTRSVDDYLPTWDQRRMISVAIAAAAMVVVALIVGESSGAVLCGTITLAALAFIRAVQWRVASRPRPAVSVSLKRADDLARELAIGRGLARPAIYLGLALFAEGTTSLDDRIPAIAVLGVAAWIYALWIWYNNRRLGLTFVFAQPDQQPLVA